MGHVVLGSLATDEGDQRLRFVLGHFTQRAMARLKTSRSISTSLILSVLHALPAQPHELLAFQLAQRPVPAGPPGPRHQLPRAVS